MRGCMHSHLGAPSTNVGLGSFHLLSFRLLSFRLLRTNVCHKSSSFATDDNFKLLAEAETCR